MRNFTLVLALISQHGCDKKTQEALDRPVISIQYHSKRTAPIQGVVVDQCWTRKDDVGLDPSSYSVRKIAAVNATKYSYFPILQGHRLNQSTNYISDLTEKF